MTRSLLNTISNVLVKEKNVYVILTTHSPTTVALAPEDSIYTIDRASHKVSKVSRGSALSLLTVGVPTLSVSFDGRRQVFVESRTDASLYDKLYQRSREHLSSERSLVFVEVGRTDSSGGEQNAGCDQVNRIVENLANAGNQSVLGLVDWDGKREPSKRIIVLSHSIRNGLESLLFDVALLVPLIVHTELAFAVQKRILMKNESYISIKNWDAERWQHAVKAIEHQLLGNRGEDGFFVEAKYVGGLTLQVARELRHMDDHDYENLLLDKFGFLSPRNKRAGGLMNHVVDTILPDFPNLIPTDLIDTFGQLLSVELS